MTKNFKIDKLAGFIVTFKRPLTEPELYSWKQDLCNIGGIHTEIETLSFKKVLIIVPDGMWTTVKKVLQQDTIIQLFKGATVYLKEDT